MKLNYVIIYVNDAVKAAEFYQKALDLQTKFIHESNMYSEMESGETTLAFANNEMLKMNTGIVPVPG
jgi:catechol 2,3-dioxygenase-like lactoylglutathione lyase family enzyme